MQKTGITQHKTAKIIDFFDKIFITMLVSPNLSSNPCLCLKSPLKAKLSTELSTKTLVCVDNSIYANLPHFYVYVSNFQYILSLISPLTSYYHDIIMYMDDYGKYHFYGCKLFLGGYKIENHTLALFMQNFDRYSDCQKNPSFSRQLYVGFEESGRKL